MARRNDDNNQPFKFKRKMRFVWVMIMGCLAIEATVVAVPFSDGGNESESRVASSKKPQLELLQQHSRQHRVLRRKLRIEEVPWDAGTDSSTDEGERSLASVIFDLSGDNEGTQQSTSMATILETLTMDLDENVEQLHAIQEELYEIEEDINDLGRQETSTLFYPNTNPALEAFNSSSNLTNSNSSGIKSASGFSLTDDKLTSEGTTNSPTHSFQPSDSPSPLPSISPTLSAKPSSPPSTDPSSPPSMSFFPSEFPSQLPSMKPSLSTEPSRTPSQTPSLQPTISAAPSGSPSLSMEPTLSMIPSDFPSDTPSGVPSNLPTTDFFHLWSVQVREDDGSDTFLITKQPSVSPTNSPTGTPSLSPQPSVEPSQSFIPSEPPSDSPSSVPSASTLPSHAPSTSSPPTWSASPSDLPSSFPSDLPSLVPSISPIPSQQPSWAPSLLPSSSPSLLPSLQPSLSTIPSASPSSSPSQSPSGSPSSRPSSSPSSQPSRQPSKVPTMTPSVAPSALPSVSPTLICHDEPDYRSPINDFACADHQGTPCMQWRHLGLTLDDLEDLIINCPVSCKIDCGTLTRFDINIEYQISKAPGLLDAATVDDLNALTRDYLSDFMRIRERAAQFFIDHVELLSQEKLNRGMHPSESDNNESNRKLAEEGMKTAKLVNLWVTVAVRGFAFSLSLDETTKGLLDGIDSLGYSNAIQNSGNVYLEEAYAFSAAAKAVGVNSTPEDVAEDANGSSAAIVVVIVVVICLGACCVSAYVFHKRWRKGLPCCKPPASKVVERDLQSPESQNVASAVGSMFSFDDTATAGTNGLMRFISSFSRSKDSTHSPGSSVQHTLSQDGMEDDSPIDEEMGIGLMTPQANDEVEEEEEVEASAEEEEPHPLAGIIPPMIVYDHIEEDEENENVPKAKQLKTPRGPSVVPSRRVEASSSFIAALGKRRRPCGAHDLADLGIFSETNFLADPFTDPYSKRRLESRRPSPIGIVMDSDEVDDDEISVASTPVRLQQSDSDLTHASRRRTKSLDSSRSILESLSDIIVSSDHDYEAAISPIAIPTLGKATILDSPNIQSKPKLIAPLPLIQSDSPTNQAGTVSPDRDEDFDASWEGMTGHPETPTLRGNSSHSIGSRSRQLGVAQEARNSFWNRSPIAKGMKDAIWSTKRNGTPTRGSAPATPTRNDIHPRRSLGGPPTPTRDLVARRGLSVPPSTPTRLEVPAVRRSSLPSLPPSTPSGHERRSSTPTRIEMIGRRIPTPTRGESPRLSTSPLAVPMQSSSEESHTNSRGSLRSRSASFSTAQESMEEEVIFEFRAQRIGKLGLVINSSPHTGPMVEQVKDYSTLFGRIHAGDRIVEVDGVETSNMSIKDVTKRLAGKYGIRTATGEVRIKVARIREREWNDTEVLRNVHSNGSGSGSGSVDSFYSYHRRNHSDPEPFVDRLSLNSGSGEHRHSSHSYSNLSKSGEEV